MLITSVDGGFVEINWFSIERLIWKPPPFSRLACCLDIRRRKKDIIAFLLPTQIWFVEFSMKQFDLVNTFKIAHSSFLYNNINRDLLLPLYRSDHRNTRRFPTTNSEKKSSLKEPPPLKIRNHTEPSLFHLQIKMLACFEYRCKPQSIKNRTVELLDKNHRPNEIVCQISHHTCCCCSDRSRDRGGLPQSFQYSDMYSLSKPCCKW